MLCDICKKNEATIHIKEMHNNKWTSINLCAECAKKSEEFGNGPAGMDLAQMFLELGKAVQAKQQSQSAEAPEENSSVDDAAEPCPVCSWKLSDIRKNNGKFGCPSCYTHFRDIAEQTFNAIQDGDTHVGKTSEDNSHARRESFEYTLSVLEKKLAECVADEDYETAAQVRDSILKLKEEFRNE